jgi:hypothetical protein
VEVRVGFVRVVISFVQMLWLLLLCTCAIIVPPIEPNFSTVFLSHGF